MSKTFDGDVNVPDFFEDWNALPDDICSRCRGQKVDDKSDDWRTNYVCLNPKCKEYQEKDQWLMDTLMEVEEVIDALKDVFDSKMED